MKELIAKKVFKFTILKKEVLDWILTAIDGTGVVILVSVCDLDRGGGPPTDTTTDLPSVLTKPALVTPPADFLRWGGEPMSKLCNDKSSQYGMR